MATKRTYSDGCGIARALDLIGERWALIVVRELLLGPKRFTDLHSGMPGVSPNVLALRLRELEDSGLVRRRKLGPPAGSRVYELTEWGQELEQVLLDLGRWGARSPIASEPYRSVDSLMLWQRSLFDAEVGGDLRATYEFTVGDDAFTVRVADGELEVERGTAARPDASMESDLETLTAVLKGRRPVAEATASGDLRLTGDTGVVDRLIRALKPQRPVAVA
ncbi:winged helix-turn-helix transcriptional regulator [Actinacidiphila sp. DG2A-62]|uniref:winged helix-turn-helix transcriptional regulator n=1 Tax=Actinacidiphila sp. DG2A-62 TaxID=3108821 RepID=UPI002DC055DB|nr:winged helix-turn-helix transcriptional regulator [Actinacidiphila sp. DG2A-62]MEC3997014.1 winged helix-turn-helix transcriptional regulator [Actinacidiphila sp. DG2A-62]